MDTTGVKAVMNNSLYDCEEEITIKKGPWTDEEDSVLINYINVHGEGHWNTLARSAGLNRTGKSCRLRWLNYLRPNVRRGNITLQEQLLILDLHLRWGNRWSKIAEQLPGRTDNEIKNYWRTRVVKQARQLKCDVNSKQFRDAVRFVWMPRLMERIQASSGARDETISMCNTTQDHSAEQYSSGANPIVFSSGVDPVQPPSLSDSCASTSYNLMSGGGSCSSDNSEEKYSMWDYSEIQAFEAANGFGDEADLWTHENMWFLQQYLADDLL